MNLKGLDYQYLPVHLTREGGMQFKKEYSSLNPQQLVPLLNDEGFQLTQSLAIIEYLDEKFPSPRLIPTTLDERAKVRQIALSIACDIHPLQNLRVLKYLTASLKLTEEIKTQWIHHWLSMGLQSLEMELRHSQLRGRFCVGNSPTMADCALVPQMFSAARFGVETSGFPTLQTIYRACEEIPEIAAAHPSRQIDAE